LFFSPGGKGVTAVCDVSIKEAAPKGDG